MRRASLIAQTTTDAFVCADADSRITLWNRAAETMFGWSAEEAIGRTLDMIIPDRHRAGHHAGVARLRARGPTIKLHVKTICRKLDARNRTHAAMIARERALC